MRRAHAETIETETIIARLRVQRRERLSVGGGVSIVFQRMKSFSRHNVSVHSASWESTDRVMDHHKRTHAYTHTYTDTRTQTHINK